MWHEDDDDLDDREYPEPDDGDDDEDETAPCPYCHRPIYDDAERCPHCERYLSREDSRGKRPVVLVVVLVIAIAYLSWKLAL